MEGEFLHDVHVDVDLVVIGALESFWRFMVQLDGVVGGMVPIRISDSQQYPLGDLTWIGGPSLEIEGPRAVLAAGVSLDIVDGVGWTDDFHCLLLRPGVDWHPVNAQMPVEHQLSLHGTLAFHPLLEVEHPAAVPHAGVVQDLLVGLAIGEEDEVLLGEVLDHLVLVAVDV